MSMNDIEQAIDEEYADYAGTGIRQVRKVSTAQELFNARCELRDAEILSDVLDRQKRENAAKIDGLRAKVETLKRQNFLEEQHRLASQPIADRDGYESAELAMKEARGD